MSFKDHASAALAAKSVKAVKLTKAVKKDFFGRVIQAADPLLTATPKKDSGGGGTVGKKTATPKKVIAPTAVVKYMYLDGATNVVKRLATVHDFM
jgi:hypothetical protein